MTWDEVMQAARRRNPLCYQGPLDHKPLLIKQYRIALDQNATLRVLPFNHECDAFYADADHAERFSLYTFLSPEEHAYPKGGQTRKGLAMFPDGRVRRVWAGIPDSFWTVPAHGWMKGKSMSGFITNKDGVYVFNICAKKVKA